MAQSYALIVGGQVANLIVWGGLDAEFAAALEGDLVEVPGDLPVSPGWAYVDGAFVEPPAPALPPATPEMLAAQRDALLTLAAVRIAPLQDAADLDDASVAELALLKAWKQYRVALSRIDLGAGEPTWPVAPAA